MIISLFGPDGVGKSTVAEKLRATGATVFSGTGVASWPDKTWHNELTAQGLHEPSIDSEAHFLEKIKRANVLARQLAINGKVVIDSDPLHKTLMHDYVRAMRAGRDLEETIEQRFKELKIIAAYEASHPRLHISHIFSSSYIRRR